MGGVIGIAVRSMGTSMRPSLPEPMTCARKRAMVPPRQRLPWLPPGWAAKPSSLEASM